MDRSDGAQRTDYSSKKDEVGHGKLIKSGPEEMTKGGGANRDGDSGPTGSPRMYPKSSRPNLKPDFNPMEDGKRGATDWVVGGV